MWKEMKRRFVWRRFRATLPTEVPVWDRNTDYPAKFLLTCCGLIFESTVPTGPGHGEDIADGLGRVSTWRLSNLPTALEPDQVEAMLASCNRETATGRRDYSILVLLPTLRPHPHECVRTARGGSSG